MFKLAIVAVFATLGILFWEFRKRHIHYTTVAGQDSESIGEQEENKDELDGPQAAEVVATWNLLNPP